MPASIESLEGLVIFTVIFTLTRVAVVWYKEQDAAPHKLVNEALLTAIIAVTVHTALFNPELIRRTADTLRVIPLWVYAVPILVIGFVFGASIFANRIPEPPRAILLLHLFTTVFIVSLWVAEKPWWFQSDLVSSIAAGVAGILVWFGLLVVAGTITASILQVEPRQRRSRQQGKRTEDDPYGDAHLVEDILDEDEHEE